MTRIDQPATRALPVSYGRSNQSGPKVRDIHGMVIQYDKGHLYFYTDTGQVRSDRIFDWIIGKMVYVSLESAGLMDVMLKGMPFAAMQTLHAKGRVSWNGYQIWRRSTHNDAYLTIMKGRKSGTVANAYTLLGDVYDPKEITRTMERAHKTFAAYGLPAGDMRSSGHIADQVMNKYSRFRDRQWWTKRPYDIESWMFYQSFRGARIESTTFGQIENVSDYDISAAYGWAMSQLPNTRHMDFYHFTDLGYAESASYGVIQADLDINPALSRGPIAFRVGESHLFYPVGPVRGGWLGLPEIKLLLEYPELGKITKVHRAVWGVPQFGTEQYRPFKPMIDALYSMRQKEPWMNGLPKLVMVSCSGKTSAIYDGTANRHWNPVIASAITSTVRTRNYIESMNSEVAGEWTDGFANLGRHNDFDKHGNIGAHSLGGIRVEGVGSILIASDHVKESGWKRTETGTGLGVSELLAESKDETTMRWNARYRVGIDQVVTQGLSPDLIGTERVDEYRYPLGPAVRLPLGPMRGGDLLEGQVNTLPPKQSQIPALMADWQERGLKEA